MTGDNGPQWKHVVAIAQDEELRIELLRAIGCADLAELAEIKVALKRAKQALEGVDL